MRIPTSAVVAGLAVGGAYAVSQAMGGAPSLPFWVVPVGTVLALAAVVTFLAVLGPRQEARLQARLDARNATIDRVTVAASAVGIDADEITDAMIARFLEAEARGELKGPASQPARERIRRRPWHRWHLGRGETA